MGEKLKLIHEIHNLHVISEMLRQLIDQKLLIYHDPCNPNRGNTIKSVFDNATIEMVIHTIAD